MARKLALARALLHEPDLLFLDIHLADGSSFEIFEQVEVKCPVIFTTAYDEYAIRAFELNSIDYPLKPVDRGKLEQRVDDEVPCCQPRMGNREPRPIHDPITKQKNIQIQSPRAPALAPAESAVRSLEVLQTVQQVQRLEFCPESGYGIDIPALLDRAHGGRAIKG